MRLTALSSAVAIGLIATASGRSGCAQEVPASAFDLSAGATGHIIRLNHNPLVGEVESARHVLDDGRIRTLLLTPAPFGEQESVMATLVELDCSAQTLRPVAQAPLSAAGIPTGTVLDSEGRHVSQRNDRQLFALVCDQQPDPALRSFASVAEYRSLVEDAAVAAWRNSAGVPPPIE